MKFIFFTKKENFEKFYRDSCKAKIEENVRLLGIHSQVIRQYFLFFKYTSSTIAINLNEFSSIKDEDKLIESICKSIDHEICHEYLSDFGILSKYQHWVTNKLGFDGL